MTLDWGGPLDDLAAAIALDQRERQPLPRARGVGEGDRRRRGAELIQYTAGSRPPEPPAPLLRIT